MSASKKRIGNISLAVVFAFAASGETVWGGPVTDQEPNDTLQHAVSTGISVGETISIVNASIGNGPLQGADRDLYSFLVDGGSILPVLLSVRVVASGNQLDGYVRLFDAGGAEIANHDDTDFGDTRPWLRTYLVVSGVYYVGVSDSLNPAYDPQEPVSGRSAGTGTYGLELSLSPTPAIDSSLEPNDVNPVVVSSLPFAVIDQFIGDGPNGRMDVDRYRVELNGPALVEATVSPIQLGTLDPALFMKIDRPGAAADTTILPPDEDRPDTRTRRIVVSTDAVGAVEVAVAGTPDASPPSAHRVNTTGFYDLLIKVEPIETPAGPNEPNDSILEAVSSGAAGPGAVTIGGFIGDGVYGHGRGDVDFYSVFLAVDDRLEVQVAPIGASTLEPVVHLFDFWGANLAVWTAAPNGAVHGSFVRHCEVEPGPCKEAQEFYVGVMGKLDRLTIDPFVPNPFLSSNSPHPEGRYLYDHGPGSIGGYDAVFTIAPFVPAPVDDPNAQPLISGSRSPTPPLYDPNNSSAGGDPGSDRVFATLLDGAANSIVELNPMTGEIVARIPSPESPFGGAEGLAYDGHDLFFLGRGGRYPTLYRLDPATGDVLEQVTTWFGSGFYGDVAALNDALFVVDVLDNAVYSLPTDLHGSVTRFDMAALNSFSLLGPIATSKHPDRLIVAEAPSYPEQLSQLDAYPDLHVLDASNGVETARMRARGACSCDADFDRDGDVDDNDQTFLDFCDDSIFPFWPMCSQADLNCDLSLNNVDRNILLCQKNGAGNPPHEGCCSFTPGAFTGVVRATALAWTQPDVMLVSDWTELHLAAFNVLGNSLRRFDLVAPLGSLASRPGPLRTGDGDWDGDVDLVDWSRLQSCFHIPSLDVAPWCGVFDFDLSQRLDLRDFAALNEIIHSEKQP